MIHALYYTGETNMADKIKAMLNHSKVSGSLVPRPFEEEKGPDLPR